MKDSGSLAIYGVSYILFQLFPFSLWYLLTSARALWSPESNSSAFYLFGSVCYSYPNSLFYILFISTQSSGLKKEQMSTFPMNLYGWKQTCIWVFNTDLGQVSEYAHASRFVWMAFLKGYKCKSWNKSPKNRNDDPIKKVKLELIRSF